MSKAFEEWWKDHCYVQQLSQRHCSTVAETAWRAALVHAEKIVRMPLPMQSTNPDDYRAVCVGDLYADAIARERES